MSIGQLGRTIGKAYSHVAEDYDGHYTDPVSVAENKLVFGALVFGMTTSEDYVKRDPDRQDAFLTHNLIRGLITRDDSLYLIAYGTKDSRADVSSLKFTCTTWRGDPLSISKHPKKTG